MNDNTWISSSQGTKDSRPFRYDVTKNLYRYDVGNSINGIKSTDTSGSYFHFANRINSGGYTAYGADSSNKDLKDNNLIEYSLTTGTNNFTFKYASGTSNVTLWLRDDDGTFKFFYSLEGDTVPSYVPVTDNTYTLYFDALNSGWTPSANVYDTNDNNAEVLATTAMTKYSGTSANIYSVTFSTSVDVSGLKVQFSNNGATPTSGYDVADGKVYRYGGTDVTDSITNYIANNYADNIYFEKPVYIKDNTTYTPWTTAKAYIFTGNTGDGTAWPGHDMTVDDATGLYRYDVTNNTNTGIIFNNGSDPGVDNQNKTADLTLTPGKVYKFDGTTYDYDVYKNQVDDWYVSGVESSEVQMSSVSGTPGLYVYNTRKTIPQLTNGITFKL